MKKLLLLLLCVSLIFSCVDDRKESKEKEGNQCKIITEYKLIDKFGGDYKQLYSQRIYNKEGKDYIFLRINEDGSKRDGSSCNYIYNKKGELIKEIKGSWMTTYVYGDNSNHKSSTLSNNFLFTTAVGSWGNSLSWWWYGSYTESNHYRSEDLHQKKLLEFDENGNNIKKTTYNSSGEQESYRLFYYEENGNLKKIKDFHANKDIGESSCSFEYEKEKIVFFQEINSDGTRFPHHFYYDDRNRLVLEVDSGISKSPSHFFQRNQTTYQYDKNGDLFKNILTQDSFHNGKRKWETKSSIFIYQTDYCNCDSLVNKIYEDPFSNGNNTNNTSNNISTNRSSSSNSYQQKQTETKKRNCYKCKGSGKCRECTKPQKVKTWRDGWRNHTEIRLGRVVCDECDGNGRYQDGMRFGKYDLGKECHVSDCISGFRTCKECKNCDPGECWSCDGSGHED